MTMALFPCRVHSGISEILCQASPTPNGMTAAAAILSAITFGAGIYRHREEVSYHDTWDCSMEPAVSTPGHCHRGGAADRWSAATAHDAGGRLARVHTAVCGDSDRSARPFRTRSGTDDHRSVGAGLAQRGGLA